MTIYALKPRFQMLLRPLVTPLPRIGVTANMVTAGAALGSIAIGAVVAWRAESRTVFLLIPIWLFARMALNAIDGMLAREFQQKSVLGGVSERDRGRRLGCSALCAVRAGRAVRSRWHRPDRRAVDRDRARGRARSHDGCVPALRRPDGQERSRVRVRCAGPVGRLAGCVARVARLGAPDPRRPSCTHRHQPGPRGCQRSRMAHVTHVQRRVDAARRRKNVQDA